MSKRAQQQLNCTNRRVSVNAKSTVIPPLPAPVSPSPPPSAPTPRTSPGTPPAPLSHPDVFSYPEIECFPHADFPDLCSDLRRPYGDLFGEFLEVKTSEGSFFWPARSSEALTKSCLDAFSAAVSPLDPEAWGHYLQDYPDQFYVSQILRGLREGFCIGFDGERSNMYTAPRSRTPEDAQKILAEFLSERQAGRMLGPFGSVPAEGIFEKLRLSPTFTTPKPDGSSRRIDHLSFPHGNSVNDHILSENFPVHFATADSVSCTLTSIPQGTLASIRDIKDAYRHVPINPSDWQLLATECGGIWIQTRMGFGGRSFCGIFERLSKLTCWIIAKQLDLPDERLVLDIENILDDFLFFHTSAGDDLVAAEAEVVRIEEILTTLGWPIKHSKSQTCVSNFTYLGIQWDTVSQTCTLPLDKRARYLHDLQQLWIKVAGARRPWCSLALLRSVVGKLVYCARLLPVGRTRLYWLFRSLKGAERRLRLTTHLSPSRVRAYLGSEQLHDLQWWMVVLQEAPLRRCFPHTPPTPDLFTITTDACNAFGIGGYWQNSYFMTECSDVGKRRHSTYLELLALVMAISLWGHLWRDQVVTWRSDCKCHVTGLYKIRTSAPDLTPLHDWIDLAQARFCFQLRSIHLPGVANTVADAMSRGTFVETPGSGWRRTYQTTTRMPRQFCGMVRER